MRKVRSDDFIYILNDIVTIHDSCEDEVFCAPEPFVYAALVKRSVGLAESARPLIERIAGILC